MASILMRSSCEPMALRLWLISTFFSMEKRHVAMFPMPTLIFFLSWGPPSPQILSKVLMHSCTNMLVVHNLQ